MYSENNLPPSFGKPEPIELNPKFAPPEPELLGLTDKELGAAYTYRPDAHNRLTFNPAAPGVEHTVEIYPVDEHVGLEAHHYVVPHEVVTPLPDPTASAPGETGLAGQQPPFVGGIENLFGQQIDPYTGLPLNIDDDREF